MRKRFLPVLLVLCMVLSMLPVAAAAAAEETATVTAAFLTDGTEAKPHGDHATEYKAEIDSSTKTITVTATGLEKTTNPLNYGGDTKYFAGVGLKDVTGKHYFVARSNDANKTYTAEDFKYWPDNFSQTVGGDTYTTFYWSFTEDQIDKSSKKITATSYMSVLTEAPTDANISSATKYTVKFDLTPSDAPADLDTVNVTLDTTSIPVNGTLPTPEIASAYDGSTKYTTTDFGDDYLTAKVTWTLNGQTVTTADAAGTYTATVTVEAKADADAQTTGFKLATNPTIKVNETDQATATLTVTTPTPLTNQNVSLSTTTAEYDGTNPVDLPTVTVNVQGAEKDTNYTVEWKGEDNQKITGTTVSAAGTYTATVAANTGDALVSGSVDLTFTVTEKEPGQATALTKDNVSLTPTTAEFDGTNAVNLPTVNVTVQGATAGTNYTVTWTDSEGKPVNGDTVSAVGTYTATVAAKEDDTVVSGSVTLTFTVTMKQITITYDGQKPAEATDSDIEGLPTTTVKIDVGGKLTDAQLPVLLLEGYNFGGWFKEAACTTEVTTETTFDESATIYAKWTEKAEAVKGEITGDTLKPTEAAVENAITTQTSGGTADQVEINVEAKDGADTTNVTKTEVPLSADALTALSSVDKPLVIDTPQGGIDSNAKELIQKVGTQAVEFRMEETAATANTETFTVGFYNTSDDTEVDVKNLAKEITLTFKTQFNQGDKVKVKCGSEDFGEKTVGVGGIVQVKTTHLSEWEITKAATPSTITVTSAAASGSIGPKVTVSGLTNGNTVTVQIAGANNGAPAVIFTMTANAAGEVEFNANEGSVVTVWDGAVTFDSNGIPSGSEPAHSEPTTVTVE